MRRRQKQARRKTGPEPGNGNTNRALQTLQRMTSDRRLYWDSGSGTTDGPDLFSQQPHQQTTLCGITTSTTSVKALRVLLTPTRTNKLHSLWKRRKKTEGKKQILQNGLFQIGHQLYSVLMWYVVLRLVLDMPCSVFLHHFTFKCKQYDWKYLNRFSF